MSSMLYCLFFLHTARDPGAVPVSLGTASLPSLLVFFFYSDLFRERPISVRPIFALHICHDDKSPFPLAHSHGHIRVLALMAPEEHPQPIGCSLFQIYIFLSLAQPSFNQIEGPAFLIICLSCSVNQTSFDLRFDVPIRSQLPSTSHVEPEAILVDFVLISPTVRS